VEVAAEDEDLGPAGGDALVLVAPFAGRLDGGLHRLGPAVHEQRLVEPGEGAELLQQRGQTVVAEGAGGEAQPQALLHHGGGDAGVVVPLGHRPVAGQEVQVAVALDVPDIGPVGPGADQVERMVIVSPVTGFLIDEAARQGRVDGHEMIPHGLAMRSPDPRFQPL
jgi:hypothetical protein